MPNIERGAREREPPPSANPESKFRNHAVSAALTMSLMSQGRQSSDLQQFTSKNMANQRHETVSSERSEAKLDKQIHTNEQARDGLIGEKKSASIERTEIIKSDYGSVSNYNNAMNAPKIEQQRSELVKGKQRVSAERNALIKTEFGSHENYRNVQSYINSEQKRGELIDSKKSLVAERKELLKSGDNPNRLKKVEAKINRLDGQIRTESANMKTLSTQSGIESMRSSCATRADFLALKSQHFSKSAELTAVDRKFAQINKDIDKATAKLQTVSNQSNVSALRARNSRGDFLQSRSSVAVVKSERLTSADAKIGGINSQINARSSNIREFSARRENLLSQRSNSEQFRAGGKRSQTYSLKSSCGLERSATKADGALLKAEKKMPTHRVVRMSYKFDSTTGKINKSLVLEKKIKPVDGGFVTKGLKGASTITAARLGQSIHSQISKVENETQNVGLKAAHKAERFAEHGMTKGVQRAHKFIKERPYKKVSKLQLKSDKAKAKLYAKKKGGSARQMKKHAKSYMKQARQARISKSPLQKLMEKIIEKIKFLIQALIRKITVLLGKPLTIATLVTIIVSIVLALVLAIAGGSGAFLGAFYAEDTQIHGAVAHANAHAITAVQATINAVNTSGADEVIVQPYTLSYNPYALISYLSAFAYVNSNEDNAFVATDTAIVRAIEDFINTMYYVQVETFVEIRERTETRTVTDDEGNTETITVTVQYTWTIMVITVMRYTEDSVANVVFNSGSPYSPNMLDYYQMYRETNGFRPDLFPNFA
jgi:hypothetical protein